MINHINPSLNSEEVKFLTKWAPTDLSIDKSQIYYRLIHAKTGEVLFSHKGKRATSQAISHSCD